MLKEDLTSFIQLYHLGKKVKSVIWNTSGNSIKTNFVSEERDVAGFVEYNGFNLEKMSFGIYDTDQLVSLLKVLGDEIELDFEKHHSKIAKMWLRDDTTDVQFMLSDKTVIPTPEINSDSMPDEWDLKITLDENFNNKFKSSVGALKCETFTVKQKNATEAEVLVGYSDNYNTNFVNINTNSDVLKDFDQLTFFAEALESVISANADIEQATLYVSKHGLAHVMYQTDKYEAKYYLMAKE